MPTDILNPPPDPDPSSAVTPYRSTTATFDVAESGLLEPGLTVVRRGAEVAKHLTEKVTAPSSDFGNLRFWASGCWSLRPLQEDITNIHEYSAGYVHILGPGDFTLVQLLSAAGAVAILNATVPQWAKAGTLANMGYTTSIADSGDNFMQVRYPAGITSMDPADYAGNGALTSSLPQTPLPNADVPVDRYAISTTSYAADQGFFLRFYAPGTGGDHPRYLAAFMFGQYSLVIEGDGKAQLWERCQDVGGTWQFRRRAGFRYAPPGNVTNRWHAIAIYPHLGPAGQKLIAFANNQLDAASLLTTYDRTDVSDVAPTEYIYRASPLTRGTDQERSATHVTVAGPVAMDIRRGLRLTFQLSKLAFATSATLVDLPATVGPRTANTAAPSVVMDFTLPSGTTLVPIVQDAGTGVAFVPGTDTNPRLSFAFGGDGHSTPVLFGYTLRQAPRTGTITPGAFSTAVRRVSIAGAGGDPSEESASVTVYDPSNAHPRLANRGQLSLRLTTTFLPPTGDPVAVTLFRGVARRPRSTRRGVDTGADYPAADWREYAVNAPGMFFKLSRRVSGPVMRAYYKDDPTIHPGVTLDPVTGDYPPWKVTDVMRDLLTECGVPDSQIALPDLPYRLWPGHAGKVSDAVVSPGANLGETLVRLARNYFAGALHFEANAGGDGAWTALFAPPVTGGVYTPVYNFVTSPPGVAFAYVPDAYPSATSFITGRPNYFINPPSVNMVLVSTDEALTTATTRVKTTAVAFNMDSYAVPGSSVVPDPDAPDYLGECYPLIILDPSLRGFTPDQTWDAVRWTCRRAYEYLALPQDICHFTAPLVMIHDEAIADGASGGWRPLRYMDPISIDGDSGWLIKAVTPNYDNDRAQMAEYEAIRPRAGQFFQGRDALSFLRNADRHAALAANGATTASNLYSLLGVPPHRESAMMDLPSYTASEVSLQNDDGSWAGDWTAYDAASSGA